MNAVPGNVWGEGGKAKPGLRGGEMGVAAGAPVAARATQAAVQEKHVPVREFNAVEVREFLKKSEWNSGATLGIWANDS
jgi:hypothetical protein